MSGRPTNHREHSGYRAYTSYRADPVIDDDWLIVGHFGWFGST
jgi:hypothetical protein